MSFAKFTNENPSAFPRLREDAWGELQGMYLRDWFAGLAMQAMTSEIERVKSLAKEADKQGHSYATEVSLQAYVLAKAMLRARRQA